MWPGGVIVNDLDLGLKDCMFDLRVTTVPLLGNNVGQVVHTHAPLLPININWYLSQEATLAMHHRLQ